MELAILALVIACCALPPIAVALLNRKEGGEKNRKS